MTTAFSRLSLRPLLELDVIAAEALLVETLRPVLIETGAETHDRAERMARATRDAQVTIDRERRGEAVRPPFRGVLQALRALDDWRLEPPGPKTSSVWDTIDPHSTGRVESAPSMVERLADVAACWDLVLVVGWTLSTYPVRLSLTAAQARAVVVWSTLGLPGSVTPQQYPTPLRGEGVRQRAATGSVPLRGAPLEGGRFQRGVEPSEHDVAEHALAVYGVAVPLGHIVELRAEGLRQMHLRLRERGLVPHSERMASMACTETTPWDLEGWKEIAAAMGCSISLAQKVAQRDDNPAPVYLALRGVVAVRSELAAWLAKEMRPVVK